MPLQELLSYSPELPPTALLEPYTFQHNGEKEWANMNDLNLSRRFNLIKALYPQYSQKDKKLVRFLLEQEIKYAQKLGFYSAGLNITSFMLFTIMDIHDVPLLYDSKFDSCFDASFALDIELVFGMNWKETREYFVKNPDPEREIVEVIDHYAKLPYKSREVYLEYFGGKRVQHYLEEDYE